MIQRFVVIISLLIQIITIRFDKMESTDGKNNMPKDSQIIVSMMEDLGIVEYDQQVLNHFLEFNYSNI